MDGDELIKTIDKLYFEDESIFNLNYLTEKLPSDLTSDYLLDYRVHLEKLLNVVSRKVSELILSHQPTYVDELQRIADLQKSITESIRVCTQGRSCLRYIKDGTAKNGSTIVEHYKKREYLAKLLDSLQTISDLKKSVFEIRALIDSQEDFPRAIQMCKDGQALLTSFKEYQCVSELGSKLNYTIELIGEQVDTVLLKMCLSYSPRIYSKLQTSYELMDRSEVAVDQLLMHFCSSINSQAHNIVIKHLISHLDQDSSNSPQTAIQGQPKSNSGANFKKDFQELCKMLSSEQYSPCLLELCTTYWSIMLNYKRVLKWHKIKEMNEDLDSQTGNAQEDFKLEYIRQKLIGGLNRLWYDMKRKLSLLILNHDLNGYRFDEFIKILSVIDLIIHIGDEFCGSPSSEDLKECINVQALNFFKSYHKSSMDELTMFLENELWDVVPVKNDFKLVQLKEFSFLRSSKPGHSVKLSTYQISRQDSGEPIFFTQELIEDQSTNQDYSGLPDAVRSVIPFERVLQTNKDTTEDLFGADACSLYHEQDEPLPLDRISLSTDSDDDLDSELNQDFVEEDGFISSDEEQNNILETSKAPGMKQETIGQISGPSQSQSCYTLINKSGPILTNSSLNVLRLFGKYIQMMSVLEPISYEILMRIYSLLDHYIMVVYRRFGPDCEKKNDDKNLSPKLKTVIRSIRESLIGNQPLIEGSQTKTGDTNMSVQQPLPNITNIITHDFTSGQNKSETNSVDPKKAVAVESLIFLVNQLWNLQAYLESLIPDHLRPQLREQFSLNNSVVPDFLKARAVIDMEHFQSSS